MVSDKLLNSARRNGQRLGTCCYYEPEIDCEAQLDYYRKRYPKEVMQQIVQGFHEAINGEYKRQHRRMKVVAKEMLDVQTRSRKDTQ